MPRMYHYQGKLGQWKPENIAAAVKEVKENKMPLATAAKTCGVPRNTLRSRLTTGSVSNRQLGKGAT